MLYKSYFLQFENLLIEICVDKIQTRYFTDRFIYHGSDYIFIVAEVWLHTNGLRLMISSRKNPENFIERLKDWRFTFLNPQVIVNFSRNVVDDVVGMWVIGYWNRVRNGCNTGDDDSLYEGIMSKSIIDSDLGYIFVYKYGFNNVLDIVVENQELNSFIKIMCNFDSDVVVRNIDNLINGIMHDWRLYQSDKTCIYSCEEYNTVGNSLGNNGG